MVEVVGIGRSSRVERLSRDTIVTDEIPVLSDIVCTSATIEYDVRDDGKSPEVGAELN